MLYRLSTMMAIEDTVSPTCCEANTTPDLRPIEGSEADEELAAYAKALGHPARIQIVRLVAALVSAAISSTNYRSLNQPCLST
jgi:hypothetical protein